MDIGRFIVSVVTLGCGCSVETEGNPSDEVADDSTGASRGDGGAATGSGGTSSDSSGSDSGATETTASADTSTGDCSCTFFAIGVDELHDGTTLAGLVEATSPVMLPWTWTGIEGEPTTTVSLSLEMIGTEATAMDDPCNLDPQCMGVGGPVMVTITTEDGRLDESMVGSLGGISEASASLDITSTAFTDFQGSLPQSVFIEQPPLPNPPDNAGIGGTWSFEDQTVELFVYVPTAQGSPIRLGGSN